MDIKYLKIRLPLNFRKQNKNLWNRENLQIVIFIIIIILFNGCSYIPPEQNIPGVEFAIDNREHKDPNMIHSVSLLASRNFPVGHAFLLFSTHIPYNNKPALVIPLTGNFGFYPVKGNESEVIRFNSVKGKLKSEEFSLLMNQSNLGFEVYIDREMNKKIKNASDDFLIKNGKYNLKSNNCISFIQNIAAILELKVPEKRPLEFPTTYMRRLIDENNPSNKNIE